MPDTVVEPHAVVVKARHTLVAGSTLSSPAAEQRLASDLLGLQAVFAAGLHGSGTPAAGALGAVDHDFTAGAWVSAVHNMAAPQVPHNERLHDTLFPPKCWYYPASSLNSASCVRGRLDT